MMTGRMPTAQDLEKLPIRAVVAYASRTARRLSSKLRSVIADDILDDALRLVDSVSMSYSIGDVDAASVLRASARVVEAYSAVPEEMKSLEKSRIVFSMVEAAQSAMRAVEAAADPANARHQMKYAAGAAQRATRDFAALDEGAAAAAEAARRDYETLLAAYGEHEEPMLGDPVHCFDNG